MNVDHYDKSKKEWYLEKQKWIKLNARQSVKSPNPKGKGGVIYKITARSE